MLAIDPAKIHLVRTIAQDKVGFWCGALDAANQRLYAGATDFCIHAFDLPAVQPSKVGPLKGHGSYVTALAYLAGPQLLISGSFDKSLLWWKPPAPGPVRRVEVSARVNQLAAAQDGSRVAAAQDDLVARVWHVPTGRLLIELKNGHPLTTRIGRSNTLFSVAFSPDGKRLATGDRAGTICFWDAGSGKLLHQASAPVFYSQALSQEKLASEYEWGGVRSLAFTPDGAALVAGGMGPADQGSAGTDGPMRLEAFDAVTGKSLAGFTLAGSKGLLQSMRFSLDGQWVVAGGGGGQGGNCWGGICLWQPRQLAKDKKPVPPAFHKSSTVIREVLLAPGHKNLLALGMQRDLNAGRIEDWDLTGTAAAAPSAAPPKK
jgi:WD40 repeat protein